MAEILAGRADKNKGKMDNFRKICTFKFSTSRNLGFQQCQKVFNKFSTIVKNVERILNIC